MLARVLMQELAESPVRLNEVVIYASLGWGNDDRVLSRARTSAGT
jgi:hypothetical protein